MEERETIRVQRNTTAKTATQTANTRQSISTSMAAEVRTPFPPLNWKYSG